jgi:hypothetical protein
VYDADGNKLQKIFTPEGSSITTVTSYINGFVYKGDDLQYINFEEGRIRVMQAINQSNGYDYLQIDGISICQAANAAPMIILFAITRVMYA